MNKLVKVDAQGNVHELYSEYFIDWKKDHAKMIPIDHPDYSITTEKLRNKVVTTEKINDSAMTTEKIADLNVTTEKINDLAVTTSKIADLSITHEKLSNDMNLMGKTVIVDSPGTNSNESQYPNNSGMVETYSKTIIDQKLENKSDINHTHNFDGLANFPESIKNPFPIMINTRSFSGSSNSMIYDGSNEVNLSTLDDDVLDYITDSFLGKSDINHTHEENGITYIDKYTKEETDVKINEVFNRIEALETRISELEAGIN